MAGYRKDPPLLPRLPTTNLTFTGNPKTFIRAIPTTAITQTAKKHQNHWNPNEACTARFLSIPKDTKHNNHGKRHTQYTNNYKSPSRTPDKQLKQITKGIAHLPLLHTRRRTITKRREHPIEEPPQNERNHLHRRENNTPNSPTEIVAV